MDDAVQEMGQRIVQAARLAVLLHLKQEQDAQDAPQKVEPQGGEQ